jgi:PAS domain-containing protein
MIAGQSEQGLRGLLEAVPEAIVVVNQKGEILLANTRTKQMFGYCHDELLACSVGLLVPEPLFERYIPQGTERYVWNSRLGAKTAAYFLWRSTSALSKQRTVFC